MRRWTALLPIGVFVVLVGILAYRLVLIDRGHAPDAIPSVMINRPAPDFSLPSLFDDQPAVTNAALQGQVTVVNVFASWCLPCQAEHPLLAQLKRPGVRLIGVNYKDNPAAARAWLNQRGNPYDAIARDSDGRVAMDFGVYGVPETYVLDANGVIRFKQTGPLTEAVVRDKIQPIMARIAIEERPIP